MPTVENVVDASRVIDPVFRDSPQFVSQPLSEQLGITSVLKVECLNPIRSFKGRGTDYLIHRVGSHAFGFVCASAGNFGQGMAYSARKRGSRMTVFAALNASPIKVDRMRELGADVLLEGDDYEAAKEAARRRAGATGELFVEDGDPAPIVEGAGTIALELTRMDARLDAILVPLGDGGLVNGIGLWMKHASPQTRVIAIAAEGAPAMERSWRASTVISTEATTTIADGIAVRVPVERSLQRMRGTVDDVMLVTDDEIITAMRLLFTHAGLVVEPAGAAGLAAAGRLQSALAGRTVALVVTGGNISEEGVRRWILSER